MFTSITALFEMIKQMFQTQQTSVEHCLETNIVKDKKNLKQACDNAEKLIMITDKYMNSFDAKDRRKYRTYKTRFFKYN